MTGGWGEQGKLTGVSCPKCGEPIVYNGNYFCDRWAFPPRAEFGECDWALSHDDETGGAIGEVDQRVWEQLKKHYPELREYLEKHSE